MRDVSEEENKGSDSDDSSVFELKKKPETPGIESESVMGDIDKKSQVPCSKIG